MIARKSMTDRFRLDYKIFLEPVLATGAAHMAGEIGCRTRSKYIRYAVIRALIQDGYPLGSVSEKFNKFIELQKGITQSAHVVGKPC